MWWLLGILVYVIGVFIGVLGSVNKSNIDTSIYWVKVIFWPITVVIYFLGLLIWLLIWIPRKLFKGICICFYEIKDFFADVFYSAINDED